MLDAFQPSQRYLRLDLRHAEADYAGELTTGVARLEQISKTDDLKEVARHFAAALGGGATREAASTSTYSFRLRQVNFSYTVVAADVDADGISIPASAIVGANRWVTRNNRAINLNNVALPNQGVHKVFGVSGLPLRQTLRARALGGEREGGLPLA